MQAQSLAKNITSTDYNIAILEAFPTGVVVCDRNGIILDTNSELGRLFGYESSELIGKSIEVLLPDDVKQRHFSQMQLYWKSPVKRNMGVGRELYARRKDGSTFPVEIGLNPVDTPAGQQIVATVADITQRLAAEKNFRAIVEAAPIGMLVVDQSGMIEHCNKQFLNIFGYTLEELRGKPIETLIPMRNRNNHVGLRNNYLASSVTRAMGFDRDLTGLHKNGTEIPVEVGLNPINNAGVNLTIANVSDITERNKTKLKLKQMNTDLDEFTYVASHDLRSPLRGISSLLEWVIEDLGETIPESVKTNTERMKTRVVRMEKLIDDLLSYARAGRQIGNTKTVKLDELIDETLQLVEIPKNFKVTTEGYTGEIHSSPTPLQTVIRNLVTNAIKHHDQPQGEITIRVQTEDSICVFDVIDDGPGIPPAAHERVFKLFQTLKNDDGSRSGVGLAVCKRLVEAHGGTIEIISKENERGTVFRFTWPRYPRRDINE